LPEESDGVSYLAALKRNSSSSAPTFGRSAETAVQETGTPAFVDETRRLAPPEKRRSARYKCNASAEIRKVGVDARTWATCTDISMNGCYLETAATYPADTLLQLQIEANNFRIHSPGKVRITYPQVGMGIAFNNMAEEDRTLLKEMLRTLAQPSVILGVPASMIDPGDPLPAISSPEAAVSALIRFFEKRQMLTRVEFVLLLRRSQSSSGDNHH
jgi:hypothetical protein